MSVTCTRDSEFAALCPKQTDEELSMLRASLKREGCRDPITCWDRPGRPILDGYTRQAICKEENIGYDVRLIKLPDRPAAICWILANQLARRNLTDIQRTLLLGRLYNEQKSENHENLRKNAEGQNVPPVNHAAVLAEQFGVDQKTVKRAAETQNAVDALAEKSPTLANAVEAGEIPATHVANLAEQPKAALAKLEKQEGPELRQAVRAAVAEKPKAQRAPKSGAEKANSRVFGEVEAALGRALNRTDELNRNFPNGNLHRRLLSEIKAAMGTLTEWRKAIRK